MKLEQIESLRLKIADARADEWRKYPSIRLTDVLADPLATDIIFDAITDLIDS
ncbi:hypothetical protein AB0E69_11625 [Kribbella sp. NPDC026611]|uniref:hypothetical protein n=1 Tax=Kribbella sp. NPDC026611 TaxID=3154911 RepID=UPI00340252D9